MKKLSKILILVLAVALICTGLILAVSADESPYVSYTYEDERGDPQTGTYENLATAITNAPSGSTITLHGNMQHSQIMEIKKDLTIDLNGYELEIAARVDKLFYVRNTSRFTITGSGTIRTSGQIFQVDAGHNPTISVIGTGKGIDIIHDGATRRHVNMINGGVVNYQNVDIDATIYGGSLFYVPNGMEATYNLTGVSIITRQENQAQAVFILSKNAHVNVKDCTINTRATVFSAIETQDARTENYINVENSYIRAVDTTNAIRAFIFGQKDNVTLDMYSDVTIKDSYLESTHRLFLPNCMGGASFIVDNTTLVRTPGYGNDITRASTLTLKNGSKIIAGPADFEFSLGNAVGTWSGDTTPVYYYLEEGVRLNKYVYNKLTTTTAWFTATDGTNYYREDVFRVRETNGQYVRFSASTEYTLVYDPAGDPEAPYVVARQTENARPLFVKNGNTLTKNALYTKPFEDTNIKLFKENGDTAGIWNSSGSIAANIINGNTHWRYRLTGTVTDNAPYFYFGFGANEAVKKSEVDTIIYDLDIASSEGHFVPGTLMLHHRSGQDRQGNENVSFVKVDENGYVTLVGARVETAVSGYQLDMNAWNHISIVLETKSAAPSAFVFINGTYIARFKAWSDANGDGDTYMFGLRFDSDVKTGHALATVNSGYAVLFDNAMIRTIGDGTNVESPRSEAAAREYLIDGGMPFAKEVVNGPKPGEISIGNLTFDNLNDAIIKGNELGVTPKVNSVIENPQTVTAEGFVETNGYKVALAPESLGAKIAFNADGNPQVYDFKTEYNDIYTTYKWFVGNYHDASQLNSNDYYVVENVKLGHTPSYTGEKLGLDYYKEGQVFHIASITGWGSEYGKDKTPVELAKYITEAGEVTLYPTYGNYTVSTADYVVLNQYGLVDRSGNIRNGNYYASDWYGRTDDYGLPYSVNLQYGETWVLCSSNPKFIGNFTASRADNGNDKVFNFDLNGYTMSIDAVANGAGKAPLYFQVLNGETINLYSSYAGAKIELKGTDDNVTKISGGALFSMQGSGQATIEDNISGETNHNSHLNVGTVTVFGEKYEGSNLSISGDTLVVLKNGDKTCSVNIEGITFVKAINDYGAVIVNEYFNGNVTVKDCDFFIPNGGGFLDGRDVGLKDINEDGKKDKNDVVNADGALLENRVKVEATVLVDGCYIITNTAKDSANLSVGDYTFASVLYTNCVTNGVIGEGKLGLAIKIGDGCILANPAANLAEGTVNAHYNQDMKISDTGLETITVKYLDSDSFEKLSNTSVTYNYNEFVFAVPTASIGEANGLVLPVMATKVVAEDKVLTVTVKDETYNYAEGAKVLLTAENVAGEVIALTFKGTWTVDGVEGETLPTNLTKSIVVAPEYAAEVKVTGLKANLSLYSDFMINLYIPASYAEYIVNVNGAQLDTTKTVKIDGVDYVRAVVAKAAKEATDKATFAIALNENGNTATKTVNVSITDYATEILANEKYSYADKTLMYYMLNYVGEAAKYFEDAEDEVIAKLLTDNVSWNNQTVDKSYANAIANTNLGDYFAEATVVLGDAPAFTLTFNKDIAFTGTVTVTYGVDNVRTYEVTKEENDAEYKLTVEGMKIYNFGTTLTVTVTPDGGEATVGTLNLDTYAKYHKDNASVAASAKALPLIEALYDYVKVSELYKGGNLVAPASEG